MDNQKIRTISELKNAFDLQTEIEELYYNAVVATDTITMTLDDMYDCINAARGFNVHPYVLKTMITDYQILFAQVSVVNDCLRRLKNVAPEECGYE